MASSAKRLNRRQRQRQQQQQPALGRQEVARTSSERFRLLLPKKAGSRLLRVTPIQWQRFQVQSRLNWLRRLFAKSVSSSPRAQKRNDIATNQPADQQSPLSEPPVGAPGSRSKVGQIAAALRRRKSAAKSVPDVDQRKRQGVKRGEAGKVPQFPLSSPTRESGSLHPVAAPPSAAKKGARSPQVSSKGGTSSLRRPQIRIRSSGANHKSATQPSEPSKTSKGKTKLGSFSPLIYGTRLLILGIGLGVMVGTLLSFGNPSSQDRPSASPIDQSSQIKTAVASESLSDVPEVSDRQLSSQPDEEILSLKTAIATTVEQYPQLQPGVFILDPDRNAYLDLNGSSAIASASTIKIQILVAFFQDVDAGKIRLDELLTMKPKFMATGSGNMQHKFPGSKYTALETATKMITISDNTATNMLIERLGGGEALNQRFIGWGLTATALRNQLPDIEGTNTTSAKDLATLIAKVNQGELVSKESRDRLLSIMRQTQRNHLLPRGLGEGATIAHKTGYIGPMLADAGLIELPNGKRYIAAVMVKRPPNDPKAEKLIRQISRIAYQHFSQTTATPPTPAAPTASPGNSIISPHSPIEFLENHPSTLAGRHLELRSDD